MTTTLSYGGQVVDAHQHFWDPTRNHHPWLEPDVLIPFRYGDYTAIKRPYLPPDYKIDAGRWDVRGTVYVETEWDPRDPVGETRYATELAERHGWPNAIVAQAWLDRDDAEEVVAGQAAFPLVRSIRHKPGGPTTAEERAAGQQTLMVDERWLAGYALLAEHGLSFDLQTAWWNLEDAVRLAGDFPSVQIILNHAALPSDRSPEGLLGWRRAIEDAAEAPNICMKVSGLGEPGHPWTTERQRRIVSEAIEVFGTDRIMFASNFPVDSLCATYAQIFDGFEEITRDFGPDVQRSLFHDNAVRFYRLDVAEATRAPEDARPGAR